MQFFGLLAVLIPTVLALPHDWHERPGHGKDDSPSRYGKGPPPYWSPPPPPGYPTTLTTKTKTKTKTTSTSSTVKGSPIKVTPTSTSLSTKSSQFPNTPSSIPSSSSSMKTSSSTTVAQPLPATTSSTSSSSAQTSLTSSSTLQSSPTSSSVAPTPTIQTTTTQSPTSSTPASSSQASPTSTSVSSSIPVTTSQPPPSSSSTTESSSTASPTSTEAGISPRAAQTSTTPKLTSAQAFRYNALFHHNIHRANHSAADVVWDDQLASYALSTAATCKWAHNRTAGGSNGMDGYYGQNIAAGLPSSNISAVITELWYNSEVNAFEGLYGQTNPTTNFAAWGHFSQVVWKGTQKIGCVTMDCSGRGGLSGVGSNVPPYFTVCNYGPPGNFVGQYDQNVGVSLKRPTARWNAPGTAL